jgi:hydrogenase nickel incorporation protein HypB
LIENTNCPIGPDEIDLGEDVKVAMFSVAAGQDKPAKHPSLTRCARLVILNKIDLISNTQFNRAGFRATVKSLNPAAEVIELSTLTLDGVDAWFDWLLRRSPRAKMDMPSA